VVNDQSLHAPAPRVSVVVPCFNLGQFVGDAIGSVLAQTYTDLEVILVDDGSTDAETVAFVGSLSKPRTRVIRTDHRGLSAARNTGFRASASDYVCALDADDLLEADWLSRAVERLDSEPDLAFVSHWLEAFGDERWVWKPGRFDLGILLDVNVFNGAALLRRSVFNATRGFDETMRDGCEDWEFWIGVLEGGHKGTIIPDVLYHYRRRPDSMSRMMQRDGHDLVLYQELVAKHPTSYATYFEDLLLRREWTLTTLSERVAALETEIGDLEPTIGQREWEVSIARARLAGLLDADQREETLRQLTRAVATAEADRTRLLEDLARSKHEAEQRETSLRQFTDELTRVVAAAEVDRNRLTEDLAHFKREYDRLDERVIQLVRERESLDRALALERSGRVQDVAALRRSWSWRVTGPLRAVYRWLGLHKR